MQAALQIAAGISSVLGLAAFVAVLVLWQRASGRRGSVEAGLTREGIASPGTAVAILTTFSDDAARLDALRTLMDGDVAKAQLVLDKFKGNEGISATFKSMRALEYSRNVLSVLFGAFIVCAAIFYALAQSHGATPHRHSTCTVTRDDYYSNAPGSFAFASWCPPKTSDVCTEEFADHASVDGKCDHGAPYGHWTARYPSGAVKWEGDVLDNHPVGVWYSNGDDSHFQNMYDDTGRLIGGGGIGGGPVPLPTPLDQVGSAALDLGGPERELGKIKTAACACVDAACAARVQRAFDTWTNSHLAFTQSNAGNVISALREKIGGCPARARSAK